MNARGRVKLWTALTRSLVAAAILCGGLWFATRNHSAWQKPGVYYATFHRGSVLLLSSIWDHPPRGVHDWAYDFLPSINAHWPPVRHIGNRYTLAGPTRWGDRLWAVEVPLWALAGVSLLGAAAARHRRRCWDRRSANACARCGYTLDGLPAGAPCPECGR